MSQDQITLELTVIAPTEVSEIIQQSGLEHEKAQQHVQAFAPHMTVIGELESEISLFKDVEVTAEVAKTAKALRKKYKDNRVASEKLKDERKKSLLNETNLIQALYNLVKNTSAMKEEYLENIEKFAEIQEQKRLDDRFLLRMAELKVFVDAGISVPENMVREMEDDVFVHYKAGVQKTYEDKMEAERKAAQEKEERERKERVLTERKNEIAAYRQFLEEDEILTVETAQDEYETLLNTLIERKGFYDAEQEKIRIENERLRKEAEAKEAELQKEREAAAAKQREIEAEAEAKRKEAQRIADEKLAEEKAKAAEAKKEADRIAKELAEKKEAEDKAERDRLAEEERVNSMGDKAKFQQMQSDLMAVCSKFVFKSEAYKAKVEQMVNYLQNL